MKNHLQMTATFYLALDTDMNEAECDQTFSPEGFTAGTLFYVASNGVVHKISVMEMIDSQKEVFIDNKKSLNASSATNTQM
jgi:hypothetical protein